MKFFSMPVVIAIAVSLGLVGIAVVAQRSNSAENAVNQNAPRLKAVLSDAQIIDSDADGLADWEETLWSTDSHNADSDSDGTKDGDEVKIGRNPSIAGPNDKINTEEAEKSTESTAPRQKTQPIDLISRDLLQKYLALKQNGQALTADDALEIADGISASIEETIPENSHVPSDFIAADSSFISMKTYGNTLGEAFVKNFPTDYGQEALILDRALRSQSESELGKLSKAITGYDSIYKKLLSTPVPQNALQIHTELTNSIHSLSLNVQALSEVFSDPLRSLQALKNWQAAIVRVKDSLEALSDYFFQNDVVFNSTEYGSTFDSGVE